MIKIAVDCFGGDRSPQANIDGSLSALEKNKDLYLILTGDEEIISSHLKGRTYDHERLRIVHAPTVITPDEKPMDAIRLKRDSSMMAAVNLLRTDDSVGGMVSTGSTGALVTAAVLRIGRLRNVIRPAFCPILPTMTGGIVGVCDSGANVDITPEYLQQYAVFGTIYLQTVYNIEKPRVAMLNIGTEAGKGDDLRKKAYTLLENTPEVNFIGNMESRDLLAGNYDLVVCDGFSGNVLVKTTEGTAIELLKKLKKGIFSRTIYKLGAGLMKGLFDDFKETMNFSMT